MKKISLSFSILLATFFSSILVTQVLSNKTTQLSQETRQTDLTYIQESQPTPTAEIRSEKSDVIEKIENQEIYAWYSHPARKKMPELYGFMLSNSAINDETPSEDSGSSVMVFTKLGKDIDDGIVNSAWSEIKDNNLRFKTAKIKGIQYQFEGIFFKNKATGKEGEKLLRGTLQKFVKGKKVAEVRGDFAYYEPQCWH